MRLALDPNEVVSRNEPFFSFEEFTKGREERSAWWHDAYMTLLRHPSPSSLTCTPQLAASLVLLGDGVRNFGSASGWPTLKPYWQWVIAVQHDEMVKKFGSLAVVEPSAVPAGMVSVFKSSRMKWEQ